MKKHKILSLLLALVLVFSAVGTAFAASNSVPAGAFGNLTGTIDQNPPTGGEWSVTLTASVDNLLKNSTLAMGVHWSPTSNPTYGTVGRDVTYISHKTLVPIGAGSITTMAYGYYEAFAVGEDVYKTDTSTPLTMPK